MPDGLSPLGGSPISGGSPTVPAAAAAEKADQALLQRIRAEFRECGNLANNPSNTASGEWVSVEDLASYWARLAEEEQRRLGRHRLTSPDRQAIALRVAQLLQEMDLQREGRVTMEEWLHYMLLTRSGGATKVVNSLLDKALLQNRRILQDLQRMFEAADTTKSGVLSFREVVTMYSRRLWHLRPGTDRTHFISDAELSAGDPEQFARDIVQAMDLDGDEKISYSEFMAYSLGRRKKEVLLYIYDLSNGAAQAVSPWIVGKRLEGVWHTGVVVFGKEYYYSKDTVFADPGTTSFGKPTRVVSMGYTLWRQDEFHDYIIKELKPVFQRDTYDVVCNNCNHFSDRCCTYLVGKHPPEEVMRQPELLMKSGSVRVIRPLLNWWLRDRIVVRENGCSPPPGQARLRAGDHLPAGSVVYVHPLQSAGPPVLAQVVQPPASGHETGRMSRPPSEGKPSQAEDGGSSLLFGVCSLSQKDAWGCGCGEGARGSSSGPAEGVWVQFFDVSLGPNGKCQGLVRMELVQPPQLAPVGLSELGLEAIYNRAVRAMAASRPPNGAEPGNRASRGLVPHPVQVPYAMDDRVSQL